MPECLLRASVAQQRQKLTGLCILQPVQVAVITLKHAAELQAHRRPAARARLEQLRCRRLGRPLSARHRQQMRQLRPTAAQL